MQHSHSLKTIEKIFITFSGTEMGKRNTIFRNIHTHLKNEHNMEDGQARVLAKQAMSQFRSTGSAAIMRTSEHCNNIQVLQCIVDIQGVS